MLKKIIIVLVLNMITVHNNFAMETGRATRTSKKFNINIGFGKHNKQAQVLNQKLQTLKSNKNDLINDINHSNENIMRDMVSIEINNGIQTGIRVFGPLIDIMIGLPLNIIISRPIARVMEEKNENLAGNINNYKLKINENNNLLDKINQDEMNINSSLTKLKLKEKEELARQLLLEEARKRIRNHHQKNDLFISESVSVWAIKEVGVLAGEIIMKIKEYCGFNTVTVEHDPITPMMHFLYELEIQRSFQGSDSEIMDPNHPEHDILTSNFFISSDSDLSYSAWNCLGEGPTLKENEIRLIIRTDSEDSESEDHFLLIKGMINAQRILGCESDYSEVEIEEPSGTGWDSDAIESSHNYALLTNDAYAPYNSIYEFMIMGNNC